MSPSSGATSLANVVSHQLASLDAEELRGRQVALPDDTLSVERQIAHGGEVVELDVAVPRMGEVRLHAPKLFVLDLQLDLVDLQLRHQSVGVPDVRPEHGRA